MPLTPIAALENPAREIAPHPCTKAATDRNTDAIRRILIKHYKEIKKIGTRLASAVVARDDDDGCCQRLTQISGFQLWGEDDPDDPIEVPTEADNYFTMGLKNGVKVLMAWHPNTADGFSQWKIFQTDHVCRSYISELTFADNSLTYVSNLVSTPDCDAGGGGGGGTVFDTVEATVIRLLEWDSAACALKSKPSTLEVFSKTESDTAETELTFAEEIHLLGDVYQKADGHIYGYYTPVKVPCVDTSYEELLMYTNPCVVSP
jgi:hypothetical protein